jgi:hypothetical protein
LRRRATARIDVDTDQWRQGRRQVAVGVGGPEQAEATGWDVGFLKPGASALDIERAHLRAKTAILIETASRDGRLWEKLPTLMAKDRGRLRVLIEDQALQAAPIALPPVDGERIAIAERTALRLGGLSEGALEILAPSLSSTARYAADGRPLFVLLGENPSAEIARRVAERLETGDVKSAKTLASLAGPIVFAALRRDQRRRLETEMIALDWRPEMLDGADKRILDADAGRSRSAESEYSVRASRSDVGRE